MKKRLAILGLAIALALSGCDSKTEEAKISSGLAEEEAVEATDQEGTIEEEEVSETETVVEIETETETEAEEPEFVKGIITESGWESEWLGMRYVMLDGMVMSTEEELDAAMKEGQEMVSEEFSEVQLKYAELVTVQEMMCTAPEIGANVSVSVENLGLEVGADTYAKLLQNTISQLDMSDMPMTFLGEPEDVTIAGKEFIKLSYEVEYEGIVLFQDYYISMQGTRALSIVNTYWGEATSEVMMSGFQPY